MKFEPPRKLAIPAKLPKKICRDKARSVSVVCFIYWQTPGASALPTPCAASLNHRQPPMSRANFVKCGNNKSSYEGKTAPKDKDALVADCVAFATKFEGGDFFRGKHCRRGTSRTMLREKNTTRPLT